jgi:hypothetical protein
MMNWAEADRAVEQLRRASDHDDYRAWRRALRDTHKVVGKRLASATGEKHWIRYRGRRPVLPDDLRRVAGDLERLAHLRTDSEPLAELQRLDVTLHDLIPR